MAKLKEELKPVLITIAGTGDASQYNWQYLKPYLVLMTRDTLQYMQKKYPYIRLVGTSEGFEEELDVILQFICGFDNKYSYH